MHHSYTPNLRKTTSGQRTGEQNLGYTHDSSGLKDLEDLTVNAFPSRRVASRLNGINGIKRVLPKLTNEVHKVTLDKPDLILKVYFFGVFGCAADLESVVVQADDVDVGEPGDLTCGTTDTAPDIQNAHAGLETHPKGKVVFVAGERGVESFALVKSREVE
jgi:hypothetical protein